MTYEGNADSLQLEQSCQRIYAPCTIICDRLCENVHSSHLVVIKETPV